MGTDWSKKIGGGSVGDVFGRKLSARVNVTHTMAIHFVGLHCEIRMDDGDDLTGSVTCRSATSSSEVKIPRMTLAN
ncbi:hypothetical protein [Aestuariimicrobium ganziense]|uniref:hypothetical protein n=1 Tax=Aestuariimicrobium ganziense TaxID=2773677 RepID=UPI0019451351|nr:hypothetical protein [Aestuariimicrobium ganziense]